MAKHDTRNCLKFTLLVKDIRAIAGDAVIPPYVLGLLEWLWGTAHNSGCHTFDSAEEVAAAAGWEDEPEPFVQALVRRKWVDATKDGRYEIHDYWQHAPYFVKERERKKQERSAKKRKCPGHVPDASRTNTGQVQDKGGRVLDVSDPNLTEPNRTEPNLNIKPIDRSESTPKNGKRNGTTPSAIGALIQSVSFEDQPSAVDQCIALESEANRQRMRPSWQLRVDAMAAVPGGESKLCDLLAEVRNRADPVACARKGYSGPIHEPAAWLNKQTMEWLEKHQTTEAAF